MTGTIGGFFPLHFPAPTQQPNVLTLWNVTNTHSFSFHNARSALHFLLLHINTKKLWLPAFICNSLAEVTQNTSTRLAYYPLSYDLSPDVVFLERHIEKGDVVLAVDYFGKSPSASFLEFVHQHSDITWIEDRAHSMAPANTVWGEYALYSPRKLLGVTDGGIMVSTKALQLDIHYTSLPSARFMEAALLRSQDKEELDNNTWYPLYKEYEDSMTVCSYPMSTLSTDILVATNPYPLMEQRKANYSYLMKKLSDIALWPEEDSNFIPSGFPVRIGNRDKLASFLHTNRIFAQIHWKDLPSPVSEFPAEHSLSQEILTLPCDHRYNLADMEHIVTLVREVVP